MGNGKRILHWLGFGLSAEERNAMASRNMLIIAFGGLSGASFAGLIAICLMTGMECPIHGIDEAVAENPALAQRFGVFCVIATVLMLLFSLAGFLHVRGKWKQPGVASLLTIAFSLVFVMIWGVADSGRAPDSQVLIFASIQFLISGLLIFGPLGAVVYFAGSFSLFFYMQNWTGIITSSSAGDLVYLAILDIVVSWIVYSLFRNGVHRERAIADESRRDELTGAKNRHYLRDDFDRFFGTQQFIMLCDIDDFKRYNDTMSHDVGDKLLRDFFFALREAFGDECTYRYGGDEFLVVSPDFGEGDFLAKAARCAEQMKLVTVEGKDAELTFSGGYTFGTPEGAADFRDMLHDADEQLLEVKRTGKNAVHGHPFAA